MNVLITGGSGLVGRQLTQALRERGHTVRILTRNKSEDADKFRWSPDENYIDDKAFENVDAIVHLAGANISSRWTKAYKKELYDSRIHTAALLKSYCLRNNIQLKAFIASSGINYYGTFTSGQILSEDSGIVKTDFLAKLCDEWEAAAFNFKETADRVVCIRTAMVLAKEGGAFPLLKKIAAYNLASGIGTGRQWMTWIHITDLANMYVFALENSAMNGSYNAVADEMPNNRGFMKQLAQTNNKLFIPVNVPGSLVKLILGEMSTIVLEGTRADNKKIKSLGFDFRYNTVTEAFRDLR